MEINGPHGDKGRDVLLAFYPELRGSTLIEILRRELFNEFFLSVSGFDQNPDSLWLNVEGTLRHSQVFLAAQKRLIMADLWESGVLIGNASSASFAEMGVFWRVALAQNCSLQEIEAAPACFRISEKGRAQEKGAQAYVDNAWKVLLNSLETDEESFFLNIYPLALAASQTPKLRCLLPYISMGHFCLSRCTGYPFSYDCPCAFYNRSTKVFSVHLPDGNHGSFEREPIGVGNAHETAQMLADAFPLNCGPAILGTADDLAT